MTALVTSFDLLGLVLGFGIMGWGLARRWSLWRQHKPADASRDWGELAAAILSHRAILRRPWVGAAHLAVFWGIVLPLAVIVAAQFLGHLPRTPAAMLSLVQDLAGLGLLVGTAFLLARRCGAEVADGPARTRLPMVLMLAITATGFLAEGARLNLTAAGPWPWASPVGQVFAAVAPASPVFMQMMIRLHFILVLALIASMPFTFMRHAAAAVVNLMYRRHGTGQALKPLDVTAGKIGAAGVGDFTWKQLLDAEACVSCGRCDAHCPAVLTGKPLSPRRIIGQIRSRMEAMIIGGSGNGNGKGAALPLENGIDAGELWACTSCMACVAQCPVGAEPLDKIIDMRRYQVMGQARLPSEAHGMIRNLELYGDVQGNGSAHRMDWAMHRDVPQRSQISAEMDRDVLLWVGCSGAFHPRNRETSRSLVRILQTANVGFSVLGTEERCCGDPARRLGDEALFQELARANIERLGHYGASTIVTLCPHCLNTLKNEYPAFGFQSTVVHATELVGDLIRDGRIRLKYPVAERILIHDACYLGRYNRIYEPPRDICRALPGARLMETERSGENGFCCGGGGGRMWLHESIGENINRMRSDELTGTGADLIGTACPYCLVMLEDGISGLELEQSPQVADIIDIVADAMG